MSLLLLFAGASSAGANTSISPQLAVLMLQGLQGYLAFAILMPDEQ